MTDIQTAVDKILKHYGVPGMKWGVRRSSAQLAAPSSDSAKKSEVHATVKANRGSTASVSNKDLQAAITRMNLERQYSNLAPKSFAQHGKEFVSKTLLGIGKNQAQQYANQQVQEAIKNSKK